MAALRQIGDWVIDRTIGAGSTGKVKLCHHKDRPEERAAVKIIDKSTFAQKAGLENRIKREIALMRLLDHPHLVSLIEVCESPHRLYLVQEYCSEELLKYLINQDRLEPRKAIELFRQVIYGMEYMHGVGICHRDLKAENLLMGEAGRIKIADFGFAKWMRDSVIDTACGSLPYAAPELIDGVPYDGRIADIWSAGVVLYAIFCVCIYNRPVSLQNGSIFSNSV
jgi:BR serine/threonine kinase